MLVWYHIDNNSGNSGILSKVPPHDEVSNCQGRQYSLLTNMTYIMCWRQSYTWSSFAIYQATSCMFRDYCIEVLPMRFDEGRAWGGKTLNVRWDNTDSCPRMFSSSKVVHLLDMLKLFSVSFNRHTKRCVKTISSSTYTAISYNRCRSGCLQVLSSCHVQEETTSRCQRAFETCYLVAQ